MAPPARKRSARDVWSAIEKQAREEEIDRFCAMSDAEVDARLRAAGHDPAAIRAEGVRLAKELGEGRS